MPEIALAVPAEVEEANQRTMVPIIYLSSCQIDGIVTHGMVAHGLPWESRPVLHRFRKLPTLHKIGGRFARNRIRIAGKQQR